MGLAACAGVRARSVHLPPRDPDGVARHRVGGIEVIADLDAPMAEHVDGSASRATTTSPVRRSASSSRSATTTPSRRPAPAPSSRSSLGYHRRSVSPVASMLIRPAVRQRVHVSAEGTVMATTRRRTRGSSPSSSGKSLFRNHRKLWTSRRLTGSMPRRASAIWKAWSMSMAARYRGAVASPVGNGYPKSTAASCRRRSAIAWPRSGA